MSIWTVSYPLKIPEHFRFRCGEINILARAVTGIAKFHDTVNSEGRILLEADVNFIDSIESKGETISELAELSFTGSYTLPKIDDLIKLEGPEEYWRICYRRAEHDWRVRNEHKSSIIKYVNTYQGLIRVDWFDRTAHLYHVGPVWWSEKQKIAYMLPNPPHIAPVRTPVVQKKSERTMERIYA